MRYAIFFISKMGGHGDRVELNGGIFSLIEEYHLRGAGYWQVMNLFRANWLLLADTFYITKNPEDFSLMLQGKKAPEEVP